jgi:hypothetical protein
MATSSCLVLSPCEKSLAAFLGALPSASQLSLSTRYYSALVDLVPITGPQFSASPAAALATAAAACPSAATAEALILVLDAQQPLSGPTLDSATAWAAHCSEGGSLSTLLVVSLECPHLLPGAGSASPLPACAAHLAAVQAWALDSGFEHIEAVSSDPALGGAGREKTSIPRVLEALESTLWGAAVVHKPSASRAALQMAGGGGAAASIAHSAALHRAEEEEGEEEEGGQEGEEGEGGEEGEEGEGAAAAGTYTAPSLVPGSEGLALEAAEVDALKAAMQSLLPSEAPESSGAASEAGPSAALFESLLGQALSIRNAAKEGGISDAARREAAAAMMEKLMAAMGIEEGEEEEGEGE